MKPTTQNKDFGADYAEYKVQTTASYPLLFKITSLPTFFIPLTLDIIKYNKDMYLFL